MLLAAPGLTTRSKDASPVSLSRLLAAHLFAGGRRHHGPGLRRPMGEAQGDPRGREKRLAGRRWVSGANKGPAR